MRTRRKRPMFYGAPDPITLHKMESILRQGRDLLNRRIDVLNTSRPNGSPTNNISFPNGPTSLSRGNLYANGGAELDPRRNFATDFGWPGSVAPEDYKNLIDNDPLAGFVNSVYPLESFQVEPDIHEDPDEKVNTGFEETLAELRETIQPEPSYHDGDETGSALNQIFLSLDLLMGYDRYGALLIGLEDGKDLSEPAVPKKGMKCRYLRPFPERLCTISEFDLDDKSPRFGQPSRYHATFADPQDMSLSGANENQTGRYVHWSRIVHVTDRWHHQSSSPIFSLPRLRPVLNPVLDARKIRGSSAEGYYQSCFEPLHFGTHPQLGPDVDIDRDSVLDMYEQFANGMQRIFVTSGLTVDSVSRILPDASPHLLIQYISIFLKMRIPMRIALGSEEGKQASDQDKKRWVSRLASRHRLHNTPRLYVPVLDRLINLGVLERPKTGYKVKWPVVDMDSASERMDALFKRTQAYGQYSTTGMENFIGPVEFMTDFDNIPLGRANALYEGAADHMTEVIEGQVPSPMNTIPAADVAAAPPAVGASGSDGGAVTSNVKGNTAVSNAGNPTTNGRKIGTRKAKPMSPKSKTRRNARKDATEEDLTQMFGVVTNKSDVPVFLDPEDNVYKPKVKKS